MLINSRRTRPPAPGDPAEQVPAYTGDLQDLIPLSPSRASDFKVCPQLFKYRVVDQLPEPPDPLAARGTLVHSVLEQLFGLPPGERTRDRAEALLEECFRQITEELKQQGFGWGEQGAPGDDEAGEKWLAASQGLLSNYFALEDPGSITAHELEWWVEHPAGELLLRGIIDRVEVSADGSWILTDYKTGRSPSETYALGAFFGLKFYALVCWKAFGKMPSELRLVHLKEPEVITLSPTEQMLSGLQRQLEAVAGAIRRAHATGDWRPRPSRLCGWCPHQQICPAFNPPAKS